MQRRWWEFAAKWTRNGVDWMAESHSFPGLSCSIEIADWEKDHWYYQHVSRWYRGEMQKEYSPEELNRQCFQVMASKGWTAPEVKEWGKSRMDYRISPNDVIPEYSRMAKEYNQVLPQMERPYVLPDGKGTVWLYGSGNDKAVFFPYVDVEMPKGVQATAITLDADELQGKVRAFYTYRLQGSDVLEAFGIRAPDLPDPRVETKTP
jgi:hypothetical protein